MFIFYNSLSLVSFKTNIIMKTNNNNNNNNSNNNKNNNIYN